jgi:hypothetical protein
MSSHCGSRQASSDRRLSQMKRLMEAVRRLWEGIGGCAYDDMGSLTAARLETDTLSWIQKLMVCCSAYEFISGTIISLIHHNSWASDFQNCFFGAQETSVLGLSRAT